MSIDPCTFEGFQGNLTVWMNDEENENATFKEFVDIAEQFLRENCFNFENGLESHYWDVDSQKNILTVGITQKQDNSQVLSISAFWPDGLLSSNVSFGICQKGSTTLLRDGKVVNDPGDVNFITNRTSDNYTIIGRDGETVHFIGESTPKCSCSCSAKKSSKKQSSQKSSSSKSCRRKSSDRRHHRSKSRCQGCRKYH